MSLMAGESRPIRRLLIANRGEIACRIIRTAKRMGVRTIAIYSDADRDAQHVAMADEALRVGGNAASDSYLRIDRILEAARLSKADAIHPGYGFLAENEEFAQSCADAGIIFVGPSITAIRAMGSKSAAKTLMQGSGVPLVPGYHGEAQDEETLRTEADRISYPLLVKASAGGGGKGMRIANHRDELTDAISAAKREAMAAFGDDHVLIEKYITTPRHIEVQIFGDSHGNVVSLFERECTLQRRHQKVVEEAPSSSLDEAAREEICEAARAAGRAIFYQGAGTVEFVANEDGFYFIEMNTRLQVEHPVTEMITGIDLVEWQLRVAAGEKLPLTQKDIRRHGHAFEARIYAEDPASGFLPSIGKITSWQQPEVSAAIRIDSGFREGDIVTPFYDPMLAKLIVHGADRTQALERMIDALDHFQVSGLKTNLGFLRNLINSDQVRAGTMDTGLIERLLSEMTSQKSEIGVLELGAAIAATLTGEQLGQVAPETPWDMDDGWMIAGHRKRDFKFEADENPAEALLNYRREGQFISVDGQEFSFAFSRHDDGDLDVFIGDRKIRISALLTDESVELVLPSGRLTLTLSDPFAGEDNIEDRSGHFRAPMPGAIRQILAQAGDWLERGAPVIIMEAMKMEHMLRAPANGVLSALNCAVGDFVQEGTDLAIFEADEVS